MKPAPILLALTLLAASASAPAEEYGVLVTLNGDTPIAIPFFKCDRGQRDIATETVPPVCRSRGTRDPQDVFAVETARVTNLGDTLVWVHVGEGKLPILPHTVYNVWSTPKSRFRRIFLSASAEETARVHVFASDPLQHDRFPADEEDKKR